MKKILKYSSRIILVLATALILNLTNIGLSLPVNVMTVASSLLFGLPGTVLSLVLCNYIFV